MKTYFLLLLLFLHSIASFAQKIETITFLSEETTIHTSSKKKVDTYVKLAKEYSHSDSSNAFKYAHKAITLANQINYPKGEVDALYTIASINLSLGNYLEAESIFKQSIVSAEQVNYLKAKGKGLNALGVLHDFQGNYTKALGYYSESLDIFKKLKDRIGQANAYSNIGIIYDLQGNYKKALNYHFRSLHIKKDLQDKKGIAVSYNNIGAIYEIQGNEKKALNYYFKSLNIKRKIEDQKGVSKSYNNIANIYSKQGKYKKALDYCFRALKICKKLGNKRGVRVTYGNIGDVYVAQEKYEKALVYYFQALEIAKDIEDNEGKILALSIIGNAYKEQKKWKLAKTYLEDALKLAQKTGLVLDIKHITECLSFVEKELGNYRAAYEYQLLFKQITDSLQNEKQTQELTRLELEYKFTHEKDSIQFVNNTKHLKLEQSLEKKKVTQLVTLIALGLLGVLLLILFLFFRSKARSHKLLTKKSHELKKINKELQWTNEELQNSVNIIFETNQKNRVMNKQLDRNTKVLEKAYKKNQKITTELQNTLNTVKRQKEEITLQNKQLEDLNSLKDQVFSIVAHDLKSPINSLQGLLELFNSDYITQKEMQEYISRLSESVAGISGLLNNLLYWAKSQMQGYLKLSAEPIEIRPYIQETINLFTETSRNKGIQTLVEVEPDISEVYVDPEILRFLLRNLLNNAYKFSHTNGQVKIKVIKEADKLIKLSIQDEGIGIDDARKARLFRGFVKSTQGTQEEKGTGLGLMLCQKFVELSGGKIGLESTVNKGSTFWFILPINSLEEMT